MLALHFVQFLVPASAVSPVMHRLSGAFLLTPMRPRQIDSVAGWFPAMHLFFLSSDVTFSVAPLPTPMRSMCRDSVAGCCILQCTFFLPQFGCYLFWSPFP